MKAVCVFAILLSAIPDRLHAQNELATGSDPSIASATNRLKEYLKRALDNPTRNLDGVSLDAVESIRLAMEFDPPGRRRFLLPRPADVGKNASDKLKKLLESQGVWAEFQNDWAVMIEGLEQSAARAESSGELEDAYRIRWQVAGLQSVLQWPATSKTGRKSSPWSPADSLRIAPDIKKSFVNHPKSHWPAGSYSIATTPHFEIAFQSDSRSATEVAVLSEQTYAIWKQVFFACWGTEQTVAPEYSDNFRQKFSVIVFRNKEAYVKALQRAVPDIGVSTGFYDPNQKVALFYWDGAKTPSTVVHELTHQFFYENPSRQVALDTNRGSGFWVVEGAALYMESLSTRSLGGGLVVDVGGWDSPRLQAGRYRRLHDKYWVPWDEFHTADGDRLRSEDDIRAWYSQAAGLAHLWLDGSKPRQSAFFKYLQSVYSNAENSALLGDWNDDKNLRDAYDRYLIDGPSLSPARPFFANRRDAVLSRSRLSSEQLLAWPVEYRTSPWLDLSFSQIDDGLFVAGGKGVEPIWNVQRLNLESSKITDISLATIAQGKNLSELDLSFCGITDQGLAALRDHKSLKTLWLTNCPVTDKSLDVLLSLASLESVHLSKTEVTAKGWAKLLSTKPRLKLKSTPP